MIRLGPAGYPEGARSPADAVRLISRSGLDALELQFVRNVLYNKERAEEARLAAKELNVMLSAHAPYYINFNSSSVATREKSEGWVLRTLRAAEDFGAWIVVVHAAVYGGMGTEVTTAKVVSSIQRIRKAAEDESLSAFIGLETMGKKAAWGTVPEIISVMEQVKGVLPVLDFAHLQARGPELNADRLDELLEGMPAMPRLHCHISGIEFTEAGERKHLRLGEGLDHRMVLSSLARSGIRSTVICESTAPLEDARSMRSYLDAMAENI
ncbi:MAG: TIM barrel protein [Methanomassiliicoccales archaeon]|nr:TIM barrel protein [Methanomassiliicoccales archaeon]